MLVSKSISRTHHERLRQDQRGTATCPGDVRNGGRRGRRHGREGPRGSRRGDRRTGRANRETAVVGTRHRVRQQSVL
ncbi:hypothetical protein HSR122_2075 [Halapricum desulfuricans]|uniref:Uncharacterized protein n=1 Tax=Halapricum desulfuricans TaxID=2841257 RepID=A0A897NEV1_9EURY|nr:hypothetical protein HSR122_2075 [Halapricum desulfuricans]